MTSRWSRRSALSSGTFSGLAPLSRRKGCGNLYRVPLGLAWPAAIVFCAIWLAIAALTRYSSLSALIASAATPVFLWWYGAAQDAQLFLLLSVLLWIMHRANIVRLFRGKEGKIGAGSRPQAALPGKAPPQ